MHLLLLPENQDDLIELTTDKYFILCFRQQKLNSSCLIQNACAARTERSALARASRAVTPASAARVAHAPVELATMLRASVDPSVDVELTAHARWGTASVNLRR